MPPAQFWGLQTYHIRPDAADEVSEVQSSAFGPILTVRVNQVRCSRSSSGEDRIVDHQHNSARPLTRTTSVTILGTRAGRPPVNLLPL